MLVEILLAISIPSLMFNAFLGFSLHKKSKSPKKPDLNAQEILAELFSGPSVIKIELIEKDSIFQWRSR